jgi:hypothetical protein
MWMKVLAPFFTFSDTIFATASQGWKSQFFTSYGMGWGWTTIFSMVLDWSRTVV